MVTDFTIPFGISSYDNNDNDQIVDDDEDLFEI